MTTGIYKITNTINGKYYIGSAVDIEKRWSHHKSDLRNNKHCNKHLQSAWNKYGEASFTFEVLEYVTDPKDLLAKEQVFLDWLPVTDRRFGYNVCTVAGSPLGYRHTEEAKARIGAASKGNVHALGRVPWNKGLPMSEEQKSKLSKVASGRKHSDETRAKMSLARKGKPHKPHTEETRAKMSETHKAMSINRDASGRICRPL